MLSFFSLLVDQGVFWWVAGSDDLMDFKKKYIRQVCKWDLEEFSKLNKVS